jgi:DNA gyrase subunit A
VNLSLITPDAELVAVTDAGQLIRTKVAEIRLAGRNTQGVRVIRLDENERVVDVGLIADREEEAGPNGSLPPPPSESLPPDTGSNGDGSNGV